MGSPIWRMPSTVVVTTLFSAIACGGGDSANPFGESTAGSSGAGGSAAGSGGNSAGNGGTRATGGRGGDAGGTATGGTGAIASGGIGQRVDGGSTDCGPNTKVCQGICVPYDPFVGCAADTCAPCPEPPPNASNHCVDGSCGYECNVGYRLDGFDCVAYAGSDAGTDGGAINPPNCPAAQPGTGDLCVALPFGCTYGKMTCYCLAGGGLPIWYCAEN